MSLGYYAANVGNEYSKSANAAQAEAEGRYSMTVAAKKLGLSIKAFRAGCSAAKYQPTEWHHTGKHARRTDYYDTTILAATADFWRGAAREYGDKKAKEILAAHNVSPLSDAELAAAKESAIREAVANVQNFLDAYGDKFVVQQNFCGNGFEQKLHPNSAMSDLGLLSGYDYRERGLQIYDRETAEKKAAEMTALRAEKAKTDPFYAGKQPTTYRVVSVREDLLSECPLYGRIAGEFTRLGEARDFLK